MNLRYRTYRILSSVYSGLIEVVGRNAELRILLENGHPVAFTLQVSTRQLLGFEDRANLHPPRCWHEIPE